MAINIYLFFSFNSIIGKDQDWLWEYSALFIYAISIWKMTQYADKSTFILCICTKRIFFLYVFWTFCVTKKQISFPNLSQLQLYFLLVKAFLKSPFSGQVWEVLLMPFKPTESKASLDDSLESTAEQLMHQHHLVNDMLLANSTA